MPTKAAGAGRDFRTSRISRAATASRRARRPPERLLVFLALSVLLVATAGATQQRAGIASVADAAMRGDTTALRSLLQNGADVNASQGDGMTGLHWAAVNGVAEMAQILIYAGANLEAVTRIADYTALHLAAKAGHDSVVAALLEAGSNANAATTTGSATPLHFAAVAGSAAAIVALLDHGAEVNARESQWNQTPLMFAAAGNRVDAIEALLAAGADTTIAAHVIDIPAREQEDRVSSRRRGRPEHTQMPTIDPGRPDERGQARGARGAIAERGAGQQVDRQDPPEPQVPTGVAPQERLLGTTEIDPLSYADLVGSHGGLTALLLAAREGNAEAVAALLGGGADINRVSAADHTSPLLMASINGHFDLAIWLLEQGADPTAASEAGAMPLYAVLNMHWVPKSRHPQPTDYMQQQATYLELMQALLDAGADANARLEKTLWFTTYNNDLLRVDRAGATPFWRAAFALDVAAMRLLVHYGADPGVPTKKMPGRRGRSGPQDDPSGLPPVPIGGAAVYPIHAASGAGYGQGFAGNSHRHVPDAWLPAVKYLVEEHGADVNARDLNGYSPVHHAASRGDNELIEYLVEKGADVTLVSRRGQTTVDMANGPVQRIQPFPATIALLESLGATNNHNCVSC